jgi:hypothetical protein
MSVLATKAIVQISKRRSLLDKESLKTHFKNSRPEVAYCQQLSKLLLQITLQHFICRCSKLPPNRRLQFFSGRILSAAEATAQPAQNDIAQRFQQGIAFFAQNLDLTVVVIKHMFLSNILLPVNYGKCDFAWTL